MPASAKSIVIEPLQRLCISHRSLFWFRDSKLSTRIVTRQERQPSRESIHQNFPPQGIMSDLQRHKDPTLDHVTHGRQLVVPLMDTFNLGKKDRNRDAIRWDQSLSDWNRLLSDPHAIVRFESKLSTVQAKSWNLLRDWWNGEYSDNSWRYDIGLWKERTEIGAKTPQFSAIGDPKDALYHWCLSVLFFFEMVGFIYYNPRKEMMPYGAPEEAIDLEQRKLAKLSTIRLRSAQHAVAQRLGWSALRHTQSNDVATGQMLDLRNAHTLGSTMHPCPWLDLVEARPGLPFYLYDSVEKRTVLSSALPTLVEYTCVSHTWGRFRLKDEQGNRLPSVRIRGVPEWPVPTNSLFDVHTMSRNFEECRETLGLGRYYWFDLFCIPQEQNDENEILRDRPDSEIAIQIKILRDRRDKEIARQGEIFRNAKFCVIWLNDGARGEDSQRPIRWDGVRRAIDYLGLEYLKRTGHPVPQTALDQARASSDNDDSIDVVDRQSAQCIWDDRYQPGDIKPGPRWMSSLWTLQEVVLRPDSLLATKDWKILSERDHRPITFDDVVSLARVVYAKVSHLPLGARMLVGVFLDVHLAELTPVRLLFLCHQRKTSAGPRADAIMSVLGCTDWWNSYKPMARRVTSQDLVLGKFPLPFIQEVVKKLGPKFFFFSIKGRDSYRDPLQTSLAREAVGSMLPFVAGNWRDSVISAPDDVFSKEASISAWALQANGTVRISRAAFFNPQAVSEFPATYHSNLKYTDKTKLHLMMGEKPSDPRKSPHKVERFAVYLQSNGSIRTGIVLEGLKMKASLTGDKEGGGGIAIKSDTILIKTAIFFLFPKTVAGGRKEAAPIPTESTVDWLVL